LQGRVIGDILHRVKVGVELVERRSSRQKTFVDNWKGICVKIKEDTVNQFDRGGNAMAAEDIKVYSTPT
jgi:hypothetical protein